jgi:3-oxoacyl-[acyl-carrier protein] reductase
MNESTPSLAGKAAIVTGSSRRIGKAIAARLAAAGAGVVINARASADEAEAAAREITDAGGRALVHLADVTDEAAMAGMVDAAVAEYGRLDVVVHNAFLPVGTPIGGLSLDDWHKGLAVVLDGAFLLAKYAIPHLEKTEGRIVFIGGATAFEGAGGPVVPTAKSGLVGLTRTLARTLGPKNVTANLLSLGTISDENDSPERTAHHLKSRPLERIPLGRYGTPDDVGAAVVSICGEGMRYMTGQVIHLTGGYYMG